MGRLSKFQNLPNARRCLYAALLTNGVVKVGLTESPVTRIRGLQTETRRHFDADIAKYAIGLEIPSRHLLFFAESELLNALGQIARADGEYREYFHGLDFPVAILLMEQVALRFLASDARTAPAADLVPRIAARFDSLDLHGLKHAQPSHSTPLN